jgi:DNA-binding MarR family transcriptional regulator
MLAGVGTHVPGSLELASGLAQAMTRLRARLRLESAPSDRDWNWSQLVTLARVAGEGPTTVAELAHAEHVRPQSMAETVAALKRQELVTSQPDPRDGRKALITATDKGEALVASVPALREAWLDTAIATTLTDAERRCLLAAIPIMNRLADCEVKQQDTSG